MKKSKILRKFFLYDRKLLGKLSQCAAKSLRRFFRISLDKNYGILGIVIAIQTFGDYVRWHPHLHALVADGLFLESGYFFVMPKVDVRPLRELFRVHVLKMLRKEGLIDDAFIKMLMSWQHVSGFNVHNQVRIMPGDEKGLENLAQYIIRNAFSLEKLKYYEKTDSVIYHSKMTHGKNKKNFELFSPLEFIAAITQHIPEQSFQLVRYYGWYSNRMRGDRKKQQESDNEDCSDQGADNKVIEIRSYRPKRIPQLLWRACIKKVWEVDPLSCPKCAGEMKIVSFIYQHKVIRKILEHLKLYCLAEAGSSSVGRQQRQRAPPLENKGIREVESMPYDDGWPGYEEPVF